MQGSIRGPGTFLTLKMNMPRKFWTIIKNKRTKLRDEIVLDPNQLARILCEKGLFTYFEEKYIRDIKDPTEKFDKLFDTLLIKNPKRSHGIFFDALRKIDREDIVEFFQDLLLQFPDASGQRRAHVSEGAGRCTTSTHSRDGKKAFCTETPPEDDGKLFETPPDVDIKFELHRGGNIRSDESRNQIPDLHAKIHISTANRKRTSQSRPTSRYRSHSSSSLRWAEFKCLERTLEAIRIASKDTDPCSPKFFGSDVEADQPKDNPKTYSTYRKFPQEDPEILSLRLEVKKLRFTEEELRSRLQELEDREQKQRKWEYMHQRELEREHLVLKNLKQDLELAWGFIRQANEECQLLSNENKWLREERSQLLEGQQILTHRLKNLEETEKVISSLKKYNRKLQEMNGILLKDNEREREQRKKYFNIMMNLRGKIRVSCRVRPLTDSEMRRENTSVMTSYTEFSLSVKTSKGEKKFYFDRVYNPNDDQDNVFEDVHSLVQTVMDGYNVSIFAYGQTGSGKTFTMLGSDAKPGIAPRAFHRIFQIADDNIHNFEVKVDVYMLELYNKNLLDLLGNGNPKVTWGATGIAHVRGATVLPANSAEVLCEIFAMGVRSRRTASTLMNDESSRSHLIIGVQVESRCRESGKISSAKAQSDNSDPVLPDIMSEFRQS
ncbi:unnamed protein product [Darwinula stevensoni]|uniref:Uncharacterized protein n=1 Tax=Darwinula stevensoni TaxID=69355 RepID=A0A7R8X616_9CRUS|nr:unnamed protein product [Darwinula stevensoni]CAG0880775.1 unnamed protein product [Darwinula stevensoni]